MIDIHSDLAKKCVSHYNACRKSRRSRNERKEESLSREARGLGFLNWIEVAFYVTGYRDTFDNPFIFICKDPSVVGRSHALPIMHIRRERPNYN